MQVSPLAGKPADPSILINVSRLVTACYTGRPDPSVPAQRVVFGTSGHRGPRSTTRSTRHTSSPSPRQSVSTASRRASMDRCSSAWIRMRSPRSRSRARSRRSRSRSWSSAPGATCSRFFRSPAVSSGTVIACRAHCPRCSPTLSAPASAADRSSSRYVGRSACQGVWSHRILRRTARVSNRSKNGEPQTLPLEGELWAIIERRWRAREVVMPDGSTSIAPLVFHRDGEPIGNWYKRWRTACKEAGYEGRRFHDLRRSAVRHLRRAGNPEDSLHVQALRHHRNR